MQRIFNTIANEIVHRNNLRQQINREFHLIRLDKLASQIDLFACFHDAANGQPHGRVGRLFERNEDYFDADIKWAIDCKKIEPEYLPATLGTTLSRENFARKKAAYDAKQVDAKEELRQQTIRDEIDFIEHEPEAFSDRMTLIYVGDFLALLNQEIKFERVLNISAYIGDGENSLKIVKTLRNLPDYSGHFPQPPPRHGSGKKNDTPVRAVTMGNLNPI